MQDEPSPDADVASRLQFGVFTDNFGGTGTQTALSIQIPVFSGGEGDVVSSRKSSRSERRSASITSSASASSSRSGMAGQTDEVKFDVDDKIVVGWPLSDVRMLPPSTSTLLVPKTESEVLKTAHCKTDQSSRIVSWDNVLNGSYDKKTSETLKASEERIHTWDVCYCHFSEEALQVAKNLGLTQPLDERSNFSLVSSPPKRSRKEEKPPASPALTLTPKGRMMSTWNTLQEAPAFGYFPSSSNG
ncbi:hypothetical protein OSTOST_06570 [Ostertagia ostertagi]